MLEESSQYRLISLCNVAYKIVLKVLTKRLKLILSCLVSRIKTYLLVKDMLVTILFLSPKS